MYEKSRAVGNGWFELFCREIDQYYQTALLFPSRVLYSFQPPRNGFRLPGRWSAASDLDLFSHWLREDIVPRAFWAICCYESIFTLLTISVCFYLWTAGSFVDEHTVWPVATRRFNIVAPLSTSVPTFTQPFLAPAGNGIKNKPPITAVVAVKVESFIC